MKRIFIVILGLLLLNSCAVHFTNSLRTQLENNNVDLNKIQFYNSSSFTLQREITTQDAGVVEGKIKIQEGRKIELIRIYPNTPAICDNSSKDTLYIIFEQGDNKRIPFVHNEYDNRFWLMTSRHGDTPIEVTDYSGYQNKIYGTIIYDYKEYYYGYVTKPKLLVKRKQVEKILKETRVLKGIKIN
jgi:hypothetical protein